MTQLVQQSTPRLPALNLAPRGFHPAGAIFSSSLVDEPGFTQRAERASTIAKRRGVRYEAKALDALSQWALALTKSAGLRKPWYRFRDEAGTHLCSPDLVLFVGKQIWVFEVKVSHTERAWWQLFRLYLPAVEFAYARSARAIEITKSFDPAVTIPGDHRLVFNLSEIETALRDTRPDCLVVCQLKLNTSEKDALR